MRARAAAISVRYLVLAAAVVLLNFFIPRVMPGDPLSFAAADGMAQATPLSASARAQLRQYYGLDKPVSRQLVDYLEGLARGDLGWSIAQPAPVSRLILDRLPWTLGLTLGALLLSAIAGTALGMLAGWAPGTLRDRLLVSITSALSAIPEFLIAIGLLIVFALGLGWFPSLGGESVFTDFGSGMRGAGRHLLDVMWHLALPVAALAVAGTAGFVLVARDAASGLAAAPWLTLARSKGLAERAVAFRHALPNLAMPLLTYFGLRLGAILSGALVIERVFGVPGLGMLAFQAVRARDYPVLQGVFLVASLGVLAANLLVELAYVRLDKRGEHRHA